MLKNAIHIFFLLSAGVFAVPPPNNSCENAQLLQSQVPVQGSTEEATSDGSPSGTGSCTHSVGTSPGVWFRFTAGNDERVELSTRPLFGGSFDTKLFVFRGTCQSLSCLYSDDDGGSDFLSSLSFTTDGPTQTYYVYLNGFSASDTGPYNLFFVKGQLPPNDTCQDAVQLSVGESKAMSTYFGSTGVGTNEDNLDFCGLSNTFRKDPRVWFEIVADEGEPIRVETGPAPGASPDEFFEINMFVFSGKCGGLSCDEHIPGREFRNDGQCDSAATEFKSSGRDYVYVTGSEHEKSEKSTCQNIPGNKGRFEITVTSPNVMPSPSSPSPPSISPTNCDSSPFCVIIELINFLLLLFSGQN